MRIERVVSYLGTVFKALALLTLIHLLDLEAFSDPVLAYDRLGLVSRRKSQWHSQERSAVCTS